MTKIAVSHQFQRSIRLDQDLDNLAALKGYVTVQSSLATLNTLAKAVQQKGESAFTWTGAYGSGKSALALVFAALASPDAEARAVAGRALHTDYPANESLKTLFADELPERIVLVGGRKSLRHDLYRQICTKAEAKISDSEELPSDKIFSRLKTVLKDRRALLLIDELGKYLEYAIKSNDIFFMQELAEFASRSNGRLLVIGILHQSFDAYVGFMPAEVRREWAKVQGRFSNYLLEPSPFESLNLIANSLYREDYDSSRHQELIVELSAYLTQHNPNFQDKLQGLLEKTLPLHGITAVLLASLARKSYGQNERSIYSFLNSMEPFSLTDFLERADDLSTALYRPHNFFDYLRVNQDISLSLSRDAHKWAIAKELIERHEYTAPPLCIDMLKTIAVIDIFSSIFRISADQKLIQLSLGCSDAEFDAAIHELLKLNALIYRHSDSAYHLFIGSDFSYETELQKEMLKTDFDLKVLNDLAVDRSRVIARRHYFKTGALRWLKMTLLTADEAESHIKSAVFTSEAFSEFILAVYTEDGQLSRLRELAAQNPQVVIGIAPNSDLLISRTREYTAALALRQHPSLEGDDIARREVAMRLQDTETQLHLLVEQLSVQAKWFVDGGERALTPREMSEIASDLADKIFAEAVTVNNELINRAKISPNISRARRELMSDMLERASEENLGYTGTPAEYSIYDSLLLSKGLHQADADGKWRFSLDKCTDPKFAAFFDSSMNLINEKQTLTLHELYDFWKAPPYGLKDGVLPIYALLFLIFNLNELAFYDRELYITDLSSEVVDALLVQGDGFSIKSYQHLDNYSAITQHVKEAVENCLHEPVDLKPLLLARKIVKFAFKLSNLAATTSKASAKAKTLRARIKMASDPIKLIYEDLPEICPDLKDTSKTLTKLLTELSGYEQSAVAEVKTAFLKSFDVRSNGLKSLSKRAAAAASYSTDRRISALKELLDNLSDQPELFYRRLIVLCSETTENRWTDAAIERTLSDLPKLSLEFRQAECYANTEGSNSARRMVALTFAASAQKDLTVMAEISPEDDTIVAKAVEQVKPTLASLTYEQRVALLAELSAKLKQL